MTSHRPDAKRRDTLPLQEKIVRTVQPLATSPLPKAEPDPHEATSFGLDISEEAISQVLRAWRERNSYLPGELLLDPAWGMLLELLLAEIQAREVSLARLSAVSVLSTSSTVRWLNALERRELVLRRGDPKDARNQFVKLSQKGSSALRRYFQEIVQAKRSFEGLY